MGKIPNELRETIAKNIRECRLKKFPGRGGGKKCAEAFGVSPQQWSPWERGMRTPDELRLSQIAAFFEVTVEFLRRDNSISTSIRTPELSIPDTSFRTYPSHGNSYYNSPGIPSSVGTMREPEAPPYGLPSLINEENRVSGSNIADLAIVSARLLSMIGVTTKGVTEGKFDVNKTIFVLRRLGDLLEHRLREADARSGGGNVPTY